ncbi:uncharacterized protein TNCV_3162301 [Trichonephila clavipes]|nr:uncharacterized protein TNCV_3162301 [Trichonephila clavipes]
MPPALQCRTPSRHHLELQDRRDYTPADRAARTCWKFSKRHIPLPPLHGPGGMAYSDFEKAEAFKDTLEVTFQENEEPYCDDKIEEVESLVDDYFDNFATCTPLSLPLRGQRHY